MWLNKYNFNGIMLLKVSENMKKTFLFIICGILALTLVTGCGSEKNEDKDLKEEHQQQTNNQQNSTERETLSCTIIDKNDDGTSRISYTSVIDFNYYGDYMLDTIVLTEEYKYNDKDETLKKKESEENLAKNSIGTNGIEVKVGSNDVSNVTVTTTYYIDKMDSETLDNFKYKDYINSKKFDMKKYQSDLIKEKNEKNLDSTCTFK